MEKLAERMSDIMRQKKISAAELARRIGTDRSTIGHYLRGDYLPKYDKIQKIADSLGVSVSYITGMTDDPAPTGDPGLDGFLDRFIRSTQPGSFGSVTVSPEDLEILAAFHEADPRIQSAVRKLLDLPEL
ncbi:MAG: helix-turn-helix transcriptional regulator [Thermoguttaceae bacterium]|nr:helix-turn-helix transcriptional regulator [Thermoguttaceae bacterium]